MAHFAKLDESNIVLEVQLVANEALDPNNEEGSGIAFLTEWSGGHSNWRQTSYNTVAGVHLLGGTPFRKNYAGFGYLYDPIRDAFIPVKDFPSWIFNEETCRWDPPIPHPNDGGDYSWDEINQSWIPSAV